MKRKRGTAKEWAIYNALMSTPASEYELLERRPQSNNVTSYQMIGVHLHNSKREKDLCAA